MPDQTNALFADGTNPGDALTCHTPLIMPGGDSIIAQFSPIIGPPNAIGYSATNDALYLYPFTYAGQNGYGYCLNHGLAGPQGSFGNVAASQVISGGPVIERAVSFIIANTPAPPDGDPEGLADFWSMLGVNCGSGWDAYAIAQMAVWTVLGQVVLNSFEFLTPNNPCLMQAYGNLVSLAMQYGSGSLDCGSSAGGGSGGSTGCCNCTCGGDYTCGGCKCAPDNCPGCDPCGLRLGCQIGKIYCCNTSTPVTDQSATYLAFAGCANDLRECCGRVVLGPFKLLSSNSGTPDITLVPCNGCAGADIQLTDFCCNILAQPPEIGDEFYIAFRPPCTRYCFDLCAEMETTSSSVYYFRYNGPAQLQNMGVPLRRRDKRQTCIHLCIDITPEPPPPGPEPWWEHILVNNNNNNNNNDSSNNDNNDNNNNLISNLMSSLLNNLLGSNMMSSGLGLGAGLGAGLGGLGGLAGFGGLGGLGYFGSPGGGFPLPWGLFPPGTTPCPPPACGGPNPCCCPPPCPGPMPYCCPCPEPCCCPPPYPLCPPACMPWPQTCPPPCLLPYPYIPEPALAAYPASLIYQTLPLPAPCFCPPCAPWEDGNAQQAVQQVYSPITVVMPPDPWAQGGAPQAFPQPYYFMPPVSQAFSSPPRPAPPPYHPPAPVPTPPLLPEFSGAPRPDMSALAFEGGDLPEQFYRDWYGE